MLKWHLVRIEGVRKLADKMMCMRQPERERERESIYIYEESYHGHGNAKRNTFR